MAKKKAAQTKEDVLELAIDDIRSKFGEGSIMRLGESFRAAVEDIPTGILPLDVALGIGGLPKGRIVEVYFRRTTNGSSRCCSWAGWIPSIGAVPRGNQRV